MKSNLLNFKENFFSWSTVNYFQKSKPEITHLFVIHSMKKPLKIFTFLMHLALKFFVNFNIGYQTIKTT